jgi:WD40 repeat protein
MKIQEDTFWLHLLRIIKYQDVRIKEFTFFFPHITQSLEAYVNSTFLFIELIFFFHCNQGWIWSLASHDKTLCTGSWDRYIKTWDLEAGCVQKQQFR